MRDTAVESIFQDVRYGLRLFVRSPLFTLTAVSSLALGIGANTAIFGVLNSLLLKPLPVQHPHQLVTLAAVGDPRDGVAVSYRVWEHIRERRLLESSFVWAGDRVSLSTTGETRFVEAVWASGGFFEVLGVEPILGTTFEERDDRRNGGPNGPVAVISHGFWHRQFGGAADVIGRPLAIEDVPFTIVGVTSPRFLGLNVGTTFDVILPLETEPLLGRNPQRLTIPTWSWLQFMARLPRGESIDRVNSALRVVQPEIREATMPAFTHAEDREQYLSTPWEIRRAPAGLSRLRLQYGPAVLALLAVASVVLLIACANIATLLLGRATARQYEFSLRLSLGASRVRLVRQLLIESLLLSVLGLTIGLVLARWGGRLLVSQLSTWAYTATLDLSLDWRVVGVAAVVTLATAVLCGIAPGFRAAGAVPLDALKGQTRAFVGERSASVRSGLVVLQVALCLVLVVTAGLFLRSFVALAYRNLGFDREGVLVAVVDARRSTSPAAARPGLYEQLRERVAAIPGVESAGTSMATPLGSAGIRFTPAIAIPGSAAAPQDGVRILTNPVSPDWFRTYGTRLITGRDFDRRDRAGSLPVVIVNEAFTRRYFDGANPVGRTLTEIVDSDERRTLEIVGLVDDAAFTSMREPVQPALYAPLAQRVDENILRTSTVSISVRAEEGSRAHLRGAVIAAISGIDRNLAVSILTLTEQLSTHYLRERLLAVLSGFFGAFALVLAAMGLYAAISYGVSRRRAEIGIRMALGAAPEAVLRMVLGHVMRLVGLGVVIGGMASLWVTRLVGALLFEVPARDPLTFAIASAVLLLAAAAAGWLPARRAARLDPAAVLREG